MSLKDTKRLGLNPFAYLGVNAISTLQLVTYNRAPTDGTPVGRGGDYRKFKVGDFWLDRSTAPIDTWFLANKAAGVATWLKFIDIADLVLQFDGDAGSAVPTILGQLMVPGTGILTSAGAGNTVTYSLTNGANGQVLIGGGAAPVWANITSTGATVTVTNGPNTINLEVAGAYGFDTISADIGTATPVLGNIQILGGLNVTTAGDDVSTIEINLNDSIAINSLTLSALGAGVMQTSAAGLVTSDNGANGQVLIGGGAAPAWANITSTGGTITVTNGANSIDIDAVVAAGLLTFSDDAAAAVTPALGIIDVLGGTNITTAGDDVSTMTVDLDDSISLSGTLTLSALGAGVMQTSAVGLVTSDNGANGQVLIGGGAAPAWENITSAGGTVTVTNGPNTINLEALAGAGLGSNVFLAEHAADLAVDPALVYTLGEGLALTEIYDTGGDFYIGDGAGDAATFTAPSTGTYFLAYSHVTFVPPSAVPPVDPPVYHAIETSNREFFKYGFLVFWPTKISGRYFSVLADMDIGDTVIFKSRVEFPAIEIFGGGADLATYVCGYKVT